MTTLQYEFDYYLDESLAIEHKKEIQNEILEHLKHDYFRPFVGIVVKSDAVNKYLAVNYAVRKCYLHQDDGFTKLFVTILYPFLPEGMEDKTENYHLVVTIFDINVNITIPFTAIMNHWRTGWPRHGKDPRYFTFFTWKVLSPLKRFINREIDLNELRRSLYTRPLRLGLDLVILYRNEVSPYLLQTNDDTYVVRERVAQYYDKMMETLKVSMDHFHFMPGSGYIYTGVYPSDVEETYFLPDTPESNPLVKLELEYLSKMTIKRKLK